MEGLLDLQAHILGFRFTRPTVLLHVCSFIWVLLLFDVVFIFTLPPFFPIADNASSVEWKCLFISRLEFLLSFD